MWWGSGDASDNGSCRSFRCSQPQEEDPEILEIKEKLKTNIFIIRDAVEQSVISLQKIAKKQYCVSKKMLQRKLNK